MADKRLFLGYLKQSEVHNRILEEDLCWREYNDSVEREWRREHKRKLEEESDITASAASPTTALDFWRQVVRCGGNTDGRWRHDGFKELEDIGPSLPLSTDVELSQTNVPSRKLPLHFPKLSSPSMAASLFSSSSCSSSRVSERFHSSRKQRKSAKTTKEKTKEAKGGVKKRKKKRAHCSCSSSCLSSNNDQDVEWVEKKP
ncbi:hypothetical protein TcWFU_008993 [Taenia crassiceps]|uniref:Uncharacterized protein n=1 Tax=Taenia crassiceps TaxID=6207 RepID=A0ABR4Q7E3_9CEST